MFIYGIEWFGFNLFFINDFIFHDKLDIEFISYTINSNKLESFFTKIYEKLSNHFHKSVNKIDACYFMCRLKYKYFRLKYCFIQYYNVRRKIMKLSKL